LTRYGFYGDETVSDTATNVLGCLGLKITVERFLARVERGAVVLLA